MLLLSVAYAANIGGTGLITGSPPNLVLPSKLEDIYGGSQPLTFPKWASYCFPLMMANLLTAWDVDTILYAFNCVASYRNTNVCVEIGHRGADLATFFHLKQ